MPLYRSTTALILFLFITLVGMSAPLTEKDVPSLREAIKPTAAEERWLEIPWMSNLWEARRRAAAEGKPILLWEMDGNPLGCT